MVRHWHARPTSTLCRLETGKRCDGPPTRMPPVPALLFTRGHSTSGGEPCTSTLHSWTATSCSIGVGQTEFGRDQPLRAVQLRPAHSRGVQLPLIFKSPPSSRYVSIAL